MTKDNLYRKGSFLQKLYSIKEIPSLVDENNNPTDYALAAKEWGESIPTTNEEVRALAIKGESIINKLSNNYKEKQEFVPMLDENSIILLSNNTIRIPLARKGAWSHESYGEVKFSDSDYDQILDNYKDNSLGFTPYVTYGHIDEEHNSTDSHRKRGNLQNLTIDDDVIYGDFEVKEDTYNAVKNGEYEYSSGEFLRNYLDKETGKRKGTALMRVALTNSPFIPFGDKKVQALSQNTNEPTTDYFLMKLSTVEGTENNIENIMPEKETETVVETEVTTEPTPVVTESPAIVTEPAAIIVEEVVAKEVEVKQPETITKEEVKPVMEAQAKAINVEEILEQAKGFYTEQVKSAQEKYEASQEVVNKLVEQVTALTTKLSSQELVTQAYSTNMSKAAEYALYKRMADAGVTPANVQKFSTLKSAIDSASLNKNVIKLSSTAGEESEVNLVEAIADVIMNVANAEAPVYQQFGVSANKVSAGGFDNIIDRNKQNAQKRTLA